MLNKMKSIVVEMEGLDGSGKTTALKTLSSLLRDRGYRVLETREVGSPLIEHCAKLRKIVLDPSIQMDKRAMEFIFAAMRLENQRVYEEASDKFDFILSDRGLMSHFAYTASSIDAKFVDDFYLKFLMQHTYYPDAIVYLNINLDVAKARRANRGEALDSVESMGDKFFATVKKDFAYYLDMIEYDQPEIQIHDINANKTLAGVNEQLFFVAEELIRQRNLKQVGPHD